MSSIKVTKKRRNKSLTSSRGHRLSVRGSRSWRGGLGGLFSRNAASYTQWLYTECTKRVTGPRGKKSIKPPYSTSQPLSNPFCNHFPSFSGSENLLLSRTLPRHARLLLKILDLCCLDFDQTNPLIVYSIGNTRRRKRYTDTHKGYFRLWIWILFIQSQRV